MSKAKPLPPPTAPVGADCPDTITFNPSPWRHRLRIHDRDLPAFAADFMEATGGSLAIEHGGDWDRGKRASRFLELREGPATAAEAKKVHDSYLALPVESRPVVNCWAETAGIPRHARSALLTEGEVIFYDWILTTVKTAGIEDTFEAIIKGFDLEDFQVAQVPGAPVGTPEEGHFAAPSSGEALPKRTDIRRTAITIEEDVVLPDGYCDDIPGGLTIPETKDLVLSYVHRVFIAEVNGKQRKGLLDWLIARGKGFTIPDVWRTQ